MLSLVDHWLNEWRDLFDSLNSLVSRNRTALVLSPTESKLKTLTDFIADFQKQCGFCVILKAIPC